MYYSRRILIFIVKYGEKIGNFFREMPEALHVPRATFQATSHSPPRSFLHTFWPQIEHPHGCREIVPKFHPCLALVCIFDPFCTSFLRCNAYGSNLHFSFRCHALVVDPTGQFLAMYVVHSCSKPCANFTRLLTMVWAAREFNGRRVGTLASRHGQTDRQTHLAQMVS